MFLLVVASMPIAVLRVSVDLVLEWLGFYACGCRNVIEAASLPRHYVSIAW